jgi:hypothetical protein
LRTFRLAQRRAIHAAERPELGREIGVVWLRVPGSWLSAPTTRSGFITLTARSCGAASDFRAETTGSAGLSFAAHEVMRRGRLAGALRLVRLAAELGSPLPVIVAATFRH